MKSLIQVSLPNNFWSMIFVVFFILGLIATFMLYGLDYSTGFSGLDFDYLLRKRLLRLATLIVGSVCLGLSATTFQTLVRNRILVPSIMGYEAVYLLWQALLLLFCGTQGAMLLGISGHFIMSLLLMLGYSWMLHRWLLPKCKNDMFTLLLFGFVLTMILTAITQFIQIRISPSEFSILQTVSYTSFNRSQPQTLLYGVIAVLIVIWIIRKNLPILDVMALGREQALSLGVDYEHYTRLFLALISILVAISTSLIGPTVFIGIFIANIAYALVANHKHSHKHKLILPVACLVSITLFLIAQLLVEHIFNYKTTVSILVNLVCGIYFLLLTIRTTKLSKGVA